MSHVSTPDGYGEVLRTQSAHGRTSYLVKGAGFEGWYDGLEVTADFADQPDDVIPNRENDTVLPYPSQPQGPAWDGTTSTIQPDIDPHLDMDGNSDSLTGDSTGQSAVGADLDSDFEPHSRLAGARAHRLHFATADDPILDVSALPEESPVGLDKSPINPDGVCTDDLFDGDNGFEHESSAKLTIKDDLYFMRFAADDDDKKKKNHHERGGQPSFLNSSDKDDDDDSSSDGDDSSGDSDGGDGGSHTASFRLALTTTADLHFLANMCSCDESIPLHSQSEHRELVAEAANGVTPQEQDLNKLLERYEQDNFHFQKSNLPNLVDRSEDDGDNADNLNHYASVEGHKVSYDGGLPGIRSGKITPAVATCSCGARAHAPTRAKAKAALTHINPKTAAPAAEPGPTQIESQIEQLMQFWAVDNNGWWHWTGSQADLALLNQMQQQMTAVGMPGGPPGQMQAQSAAALVAPLLEAGEGAGVGSMLGGGQAAQSPGAALESFNGGPDLGVAHHGVPFSTTEPDGSTTRHSFAIESNTPPQWREYLQVIASDRLVALAAWRDVVDKSKRLRAEGAINVEAFRPDIITAYIQGDNGKYYTTVQRLGSVPGAGRQLTSTQVSGWSCECDWGHWAWLRKRSFVGRMCSHAYALFSEMRSLDAKARKNKGKPLSAGKFASVNNKSAWSRDGEGFSWVSDDPAMPTAAISRTAAGWNAQVWSDGTTEDSLNLGTFRHSEYARRAISQVIIAHVKFSADGDVDMVGESSPDQSTGYDNTSPYADDGAPEPVLDNQDNYDEGPGPGIQESKTSAFSALAEAATGDDDEGPESDDDGIEEEDPEDGEEALDEEIAEDENGGDSDDDSGHDEPHKRDDSDDDDEDEEGTDNPGDDSDDDGIEKHSSVAELQRRFGLSHLAGAQYSMAQQNNLVREGEGKSARNRGDLNLTGTHYEAASAESPEDTLAFLF